jgi:hypothetical protein
LRIRTHEIREACDRARKIAALELVERSVVRALLGGGMAGRAAGGGTPGGIALPPLGCGATTPGTPPLGPGGSTVPPAAAFGSPGGAAALAAPSILRTRESRST